MTCLRMGNAINVYLMQKTHTYAASQAISSPDDCSARP